MCLELTWILSPTMITEQFHWQLSEPCVSSPTGPRNSSALYIISAEAPPKYSLFTQALGFYLHSFALSPVMLVLAETAIGFVVFKLSSDAKLDNKDLWKEFETPEGANKAYVTSTDCSGQLERYHQAQGPSYPKVYLYCYRRRRSHCYPRWTIDGHLVQILSRRYGWSGGS